MLKKLLLSATLLVAAQAWTEEAPSTFRQLMGDDNLASMINALSPDEQEKLVRFLASLDDIYQKYTAESREIEKEHIEGIEVLKKVLQVDGFNFSFSLVPYRNVPAEAEMNSECPSCSETCSGEMHAE